MTEEGAYRDNPWVWDPLGTQMQGSDKERIFQGCWGMDSSSNDQDLGLPDWHLAPQGMPPRWQSSWPDADASILLRFFALFTHFLRRNCVSSRRCSQLPPSSPHGGSVCARPVSCLCFTPAAPREEPSHLSIKRALMTCSSSPEPPDCTLQALIN